MKKLLLIIGFLLIATTCFAQTPTISKDTDKQLYRIKDVGEDKDEIVIGDDKNSSKYKPKITFSKWKNLKTNLPENTLSIRYDGITGTPAFSSGQLKVTNTEQEFYVLPVEDGLKFGVNFLKKPASNKIIFQLEGWEEFDFDYQPPLTQEIQLGEREDSIITLVTETEAINQEGRVVVSRPADVVGSYAVFHKTKRDHIIGETNYKTGKFGHYYRPKFIDADGVFVWANLNIKDGMVTITIPQDFLDKAKYPIKANDTFGYTTQGGTTAEHAGGTVRIFVDNAPASNGTTVDIKFNCGTVSTSAKWRGVLYKSTYERVDYGNEQDASKNNFVASTLTGQAVTGGTNYGPGVWLANTQDMSYDTSTKTLKRMTLTYHATNPPSDPFVYASQIANVRYAIYCDYTPSAATATLTGTVTTATETDIVNGGKTIILTLTNDTWIAAGAASFDLQRQNIINGLTSAQSETLGWNLVPKALQSVGGVVRTSDTVVTITLDAFATYNITANETITATIPGSALTGGASVVASPTFTITASGGGVVTHSWGFIDEGPF